MSDPVTPAEEAWEVFCVEQGVEAGLEEVEVPAVSVIFLAGWQAAEERLRPLLGRALEALDDLLADDACDLMPAATKTRAIAVLAARSEEAQKP